LEIISTEYTFVSSGPYLLCSLSNALPILHGIFVIGSPILLILGYNMWKNLEGIGGRYD
jgi:ABC-type uncharacterized transport system permease subunit